MLETSSNRCSLKVFLVKQIKEAVNSMKNGTSPDVDQLTREQLKSGPSLSHLVIANILNQTAATWEFPKVLNQDLLIPLQKCGKAKGPPANMRPMVLLSMLKKALVICFLKPIADLETGQQNKC